MSTACEIHLNLVDVAAKTDSTPFCTYNSLFATISNLKNEENEIPIYSTLEWNYFVLDGSMEHLPNDLSDTKYPIFSEQVSDENSMRLNDNVLTIDFTVNHSSSGITLEFHGDYAKSVRIIWKDSLNNVLADRNFSPNALVYFCENTVDNFRYLEITLTGSNAPYRYLRLVNLDYGSKLIFNAKKISNAKLLEEIDPISSELSINEISFTLLDTDKDFNILNPQGKYKQLQKKQKVVVYEYLDAEMKNMGTFYLNNWKSNSEIEISFTAIDAIGLLDQTKFKKGRIYNNETASTIISEIMQSAGWEKYTIDNGLGDILLSGYIPICTHREALQLVVFCMRALADCSRSKDIKIYRPSTAADSKINYNRQFDQPLITIRNYVNSIEITTHEYALESTTENVFNGTLQAGFNEVTFSEPCANLSITGGTIIESGVNYAIVNVVTEGNVTITANKYKDNTSTFVKNAEVDAGEVQTVKEVKEATLITSSNAFLMAEHLFEYYNYRRMAEQEFLLEGEAVGRWVNLRTQYELYISGIITKQEIDLTGGFISKTTIVGYNTSDTDFIFAGLELYTGEQIGVI